VKLRDLKSDLSSCMEDNSVLKGLFITALLLPESECLVSASSMYAAMNALSVKRRGREELDIVRHSWTKIS
jgi:hypothetical protein